MNKKCTYKFVEDENTTWDDGSVSGKYVCSRCNGQFRDDYFESLIGVKIKYCPYCGAEIENTILRESK